MNRTSKEKPFASNISSTGVGQAVGEGEISESSKRVSALYSNAYGPLIAWLQEQARSRGDTAQEMCKHLGVTFGYIAQLRSGQRKLSGISDDFATACARYLGVPTIVVKLLAGRITLTDFDIPTLTQEEVLRLAVIRMQAHPRARELLTVDPRTLPLDAQRMMVLTFGEAVGEDMLAQPQLPPIIKDLKAAAVIHDKNVRLALGTGK